MMNAYIDSIDQINPSQSDVIDVCALFTGHNALSNFTCSSTKDPEYLYMYNNPKTTGSWYLKNEDNYDKC